MITEGLMDVGQFSITIDAPRRIRDQFGQNDMICVLPTDLQNVTDPDVIVALCSFSGIVESVDDGTFFTLNGPSTAALLGTSDGNGPSPLSFTTTSDVDDVLLAQFLDGTDSNGFVLGTATSVPATDINFLIADVQNGLTVRGVLLEIASKHNIEYRANPDLTIDFGPPDNATMWVQDPDVFITPLIDGQDFRYSVLSGDVSTGTTWQDYLQRIIITGTEGPTTSGAVVDTAGPVPKQGNFTDDVKWMKWVDVGGLNGLLQQGADLLENTYSEKSSIEANVTCWDPSRHFRCGDYLGLWDPRAGAYDFANQRTILGHETFPVFARCLQRTRPVRNGMGVYRLANDGGEPLNLTEWVRWETGASRLTLGWRPPSIGEQIRQERRR